MLDLRQPSGIFFSITGAILVGVSFTNPHAAMTDANVDLYTGLAMLVFGGILLALAYRGRRA
ncbi:MAG: hypothetical protein JWN34_4337 [Bryobacterales bacterium]|jgi:hypothetical protein|nr:hypothetical protein [Bryobacterales bacterium]